MNNDEATAKEKIFTAAKELVSAGKGERQITTREIARKAGVNLALVNYYYDSKENLLSEVVGTMMGDIIAPYGKGKDPEADALSRLRNILIQTSDAAFKYRNICKIALGRELKSGCENSCKLVLPLLKEILSNRDASDLQIIALQLMMPFHHIVLNPELYNRILNTDFFNKKRRRETINQMLDCILSAQFKEEG